MKFAPSNPLLRTTVSMYEIATSTSTSTYHHKQPDWAGYASAWFVLSDYKPGARLSRTMNLLRRGMA